MLLVRTEHNSVRWNSNSAYRFHFPEPIIQINKFIDIIVRILLEGACIPEVEFVKILEYNSHLRKAGG